VLPHFDPKFDPKIIANILPLLLYIGNNN